MELALPAQKARLDMEPNLEAFSRVNKGQSERQQQQIIRTTGPKETHDSGFSTFQKMEAMPSMQGRHEVSTDFNCRL